MLDKQDFGTSQAPRGRVILEAFYQDRADALKEIKDTSPQTSSVPPISNTVDEYYFNPSDGP